MDVSTTGDARRTVEDEDGTFGDVSRTHGDAGG